MKHGEDLAFRKKIFKKENKISDDIWQRATSRRQKSLEAS